MGHEKHRIIAVRGLLGRLGFRGFGGFRGVGLHTRRTILLGHAILHKCFFMSKYVCINIYIYVYVHFCVYVSYV